MSARLTSEIESGSLLPTPVASNGYGNRSGYPGAPFRPSLIMMAAKNLWPTPTAQDANGRDRHNQRDGSVTLSLLGQARAWPTPRATDGTHGGRVTSRKSREGGNLVEAMSAEIFPTPTVNDAKNNGVPSQAERNSPPLNAVVATGGRVLNPTWVERLMNWPTDWTKVPALGVPILGAKDGKTESRARLGRKTSPTAPPVSRPSEMDRFHCVPQPRGGC